MSEQLLNIDQVARRLGVVRTTVTRHLPKLQAKGLQKVELSCRAVRYRAASLDRLIIKAAERSEPIFD